MSTAVEADSFARYLRRHHDAPSRTSTRIAGTIAPAIFLIDEGYAMRTAVTVITDDGRVAVPADVQQQLGVGADDPVEWVIEDDGTVRVTRAGRLTLESVRGAAGSLREPMPWSDMLQIAREDAARAMPGEHGR